MKTIQLARGGPLRVDDEDFEALSQYQWKIYHRTKGSSYIRGYDQVNRLMIAIGVVLFPELRGVQYWLAFKDGNMLNWQKKNLTIRTHRTDVFKKSFKVPWCPLGPALLLPAKSGRSKVCLACPDHFDGPYWRCMSRAAKEHFDGWRREDEERTLHEDSGS